MYTFDAKSKPARKSKSLCLNSAWVMLLLLFSAQGLPGQNFEWSTSNQDLPSTVSYERGRVSLFADYAHPNPDEQIPVYLINDTSKEILLEAEDSDIYIKLETLNDEGEWVRAQMHEYSFCGNSYIQYPLPAGHFIQVDGYQSAYGDSAKVRYSLYRQSVKCVSNMGELRVSPNDVLVAESDRFSVQTGDLAWVKKVALGEGLNLEPNIEGRDLQEFAIWVLGSGEFDKEESEKILQEVLCKFPNQKWRVYDALGIKQDGCGSMDEKPPVVRKGRVRRLSLGSIAISLVILNMARARYLSQNENGDKK